MDKPGKLKTPEWILKGYDSLKEYEKAIGKKFPKKSAKEKTFKIKECPECESDNVRIILTGEETKTGRCDWECRKCGWHGSDIIEKELNEDEFMKYLDEKGEEVA